MSNPIDNIESLAKARLERADCCANSWCGKQISSTRQIQLPGTDICDGCAKIDSHEEER